MMSSAQIPSWPVEDGSVLVVEDDPVVARILHRTLLSSGLHVTVVEDEAAALACADTLELDALVVDMRLPNMSGLTLARFIRVKQPDVTIVAITGQPGFDGAIEAHELGVVEYLAKPIERVVLLDTVRKAVKLRRLSQARREAIRALEEEGPHTTDVARSGQRLDRALRKMFLAFQPIVDVRTKTTFGFEALFRSTEEGCASPLDVLAMAEKLGRTDEIGTRVRDLAAAVLPSLPDDTTLFVNLHPKDLQDETLYDPAHPLSASAHKIILEITERTSVHELKDLELRVLRLRELGFRIAIDDLGAGYAGLTAFAMLEPELVKLDMSLVRNIHRSPVRQRMVASIVALCHDLGNRVVTEGVEVAEERDTLIELGCDLMQGYYFARPGAPFPGVTWT